MECDNISTEPRTKILLVDDQPANLVALRAVLDPLNHEIIEAQSGEEALRQLLHHEVAVVLLDIQMPDLDGFDVARLMRGREKDRHTPIIFLTAFEDHRFTIAEAYSLGAVDYLVKPIVPAVLLAKVAFFVELFQKAELLKRLGYEEREKGRESEARKAAILETALDCIITIDHESRIVEFNPAAERTFGYRKAEVLGQRMPELIMPPQHRAAHHRGMARYLATQEGPLLGRRIESTAIRADGSEFPIELSIVPHGSPARPHFTAYLRDITDRREAEKQLRAAIQREQQRAEQLREADRRKDEFLAMLAHELRNPLAAIVNSLRIAGTPGIEPEALRWSQEVMERQVAQLTRLIDDLLDVSRITRGKITLRKQVQPLERLIERAVDAVRPQLQAKQHEFHLSLDEASPLWVNVDPVRMEQILGNLLTNAAKYTPAGGRIVLTAGREDDDATVRVKDNGIGISREMMPRLFDLFAQADRSLDRSHGGLGIGLTLVRTLIEMHGGTVTAASEGEGRGSEFVIRLPVCEPVVAESRPPQRQQWRPPKRVLVVDDNRDAAVTLAMVLTAAGHVTQVACSGPDAIELAESFQPEVVLLDIGLPEMNGYEVARRLGELHWINGPLLIAVTGYSQPSDYARSKAAGFDHHLVKPIDVAELLDLCAVAEKCSTAALE